MRLFHYFARLLGVVAVLAVSTPAFAELRVATLAVTTDGSGAATAQSGRIRGYIHQVTYVPPGSNALDANYDFTLVGVTTGQTVLAVTNGDGNAARWAPRQPLHAAADASALLYADAGKAVTDRIAIDEAVLLTIAQGGNAQSGTFYVVFDDAR